MVKRTNEELVARIKAGVDVADNMLVLWKQNKGFIYSIVNRFRGLAETDDLEQEGYLALYDAIDGYDPELGYKFLTYAEYKIKQRIVRYIMNNGTVRIPVHEGERLKEYKKLVNAYCTHLGRKPTRHEIATQMGMSYKMIMDLEKAAQMARLRSLDSLIVADDDSITVGDMVPDDVDIEGNILDYIQNEELKAVLWPMVDELPEQQGEVLRQRYQEEKTLKDIGECLGVSIERARQIELRAMRNLRCSRNTRLLKPYLEDERAYNMGLTGTGAESFSRTWTSATERAAIELYEELQRI